MAYYRLDVGHADKNYNFPRASVTTRLERQRRNQTRQEIQAGLTGHDSSAMVARGGKEERTRDFFQQRKGAPRPLPLMGQDRKLL